MRLQVPILKTFEFGRPQLYAGLMLLGLLTLALIAVHTKQFPEEEVRKLPKFQWVISGLVLQPASAADEILLYRLLTPPLRPDLSSNAKVRGLEWLAVAVRLPLVIFGLWLGGALWWVSRRLYNNAGGYVALGLYCSSPFILEASSTVNTDILAAWGLFAA